MDEGCLGASKTLFAKTGQVRLACGLRLLTLMETVGRVSEPRNRVTKSVLWEDSCGSRGWQRRARGWEDRSPLFSGPVSAGGLSTAEYVGVFPR